MVVVLASACTTTRYVEVPVTHTDTLYISKEKRDSIFLHDSIHVKEKGDTVWYERWHTKYMEKVVHDTLYQHRVDSVGVPYRVEVSVGKPLSTWQKVRMRAGEVLLLLLVVLVTWGGWKIARRVRI